MFRTDDAPGSKLFREVVCGDPVQKDGCASATFGAKRTSGRPAAIGGRLPGFIQPDRSFLYKTSIPIGIKLTMGNIILPGVK